MSRSKSTLAVVVGSVAFLGSLAFAEGGGVVVRDAFPFQYYGVPYYGPGEVEIGSGGTILIRVGSIELPSGLESWQETGDWVVEAFQFPFDAEGTRLVVAHGEAFLDRANRQLEARGIGVAEVERSLSLETRTREGKGDSTTVFQVRGLIDLDYDASTGLLSLTAYGYDEDAVVFNLDAVVRSKETVSGREALPVAPEAVSATDDGAPFVLYAEGSEFAAASTCSIACDRGSGSISCSDSGCKCVCSSGKPSCSCTNRAAAY